MKEMAGSYEALFSRRAIKYKELGLKDKALTEKITAITSSMNILFWNVPWWSAANKFLSGMIKKRWKP